MPRSPSVSAKLHEELSTKLEELLDEKDDMASKKAPIVRAINQEAKVVSEAIFACRERLKGRNLEQTEIPGTEQIQRRRDRAVAAILKGAGKLVEELEDDEPEAAPKGKKGKRFGDGVDPDERLPPGDRE